MDHKLVKLLIGMGMEQSVPSSLQGHCFTNSELIQEIYEAQPKLDALAALDPTKFAHEIGILRTEVDALQAKLHANDKDDILVEASPGAESDLAVKLNPLLSKHLKTMANEEEQCTAQQDELDNQIARLQASQALAIRQNQLKDRASNELKSALELKGAGLAEGADCKMTTVADLQAKQEVEQVICEAIIPQ